ncbi:MAG: FAD-dependent oxidoreductase, partial [Bdellovibrionales bacterium]|nr:FAD-dependent oxidoreductase [Bdellovibrionales bacterium]
PDLDIMEFPAQTFFSFFRNHGMLEFRKRPTWQTVVGGSHSYIKAFQNRFSGRILLNSSIRSVHRSSQSAAVHLSDGSTMSFDRIVFATHADQALGLLESPSDAENRLLGEWRYHKNRVVLHSDPTVLPRNRKLWASWNYYRSLTTTEQSRVPITYYMNKLQGLKGVHHYFVTLNRSEEIDSTKVIYETEYLHPVFTARAIATQEEIALMNGENSSYFCGSYMGYGFHEDAVKSSVAVAKQLGCDSWPSVS